MLSQEVIRVKRLPFNDPDIDEISPALYDNGLVYSSNKKSSIVKTTDLNNSYPFKLYFVEIKNRRKWANPRQFASEISGRLQETSASFSDDFNIMYFTRTISSEDKLGSLQKTNEKQRLGIYQATNTGSKWILSREFPSNDALFDIAFPCISPKGDKLFFSMREEDGNYDIYYSEQVNGRWANPIKMGPNINTDLNEITPFFHENGRLYFSSEGHNSTGGFDIFYTEQIDGDWISPINLPRQINSRRNDFGYVLSAKMDTGYFCSDRRNNNYDIYFFSSGFPEFDECPQQVEETFCYDFTETGSMDLDTTSLKYEWDFGDGHKVRSIDADHCFEKPGKYIVSLNVIDTLTGEVYFSEATYELEVLRYEQPYIRVPDTVKANNDIAMDADSSVIRSFTPGGYFWDFGDGTSEKGTITEHAYSRAGVYYIRLGIVSAEDDPENEEIDFSQRSCTHKQIIVIKNTDE